MNVLLDTHIALWAIADSPKLSKQARKHLLTPQTNIYVSSVSIWEIAIKHSLKPQNMLLSADQALAYFKQAGYHLLSITPEHCVKVGTLAHYHADPFDRLLIAQALSEPMVLMTHDSTVASYSETVLLV